MLAPMNPRHFEYTYNSCWPVILGPLNMNGQCTVANIFHRFSRFCRFCFIRVFHFKVLELNIYAFIFFISILSCGYRGNQLGILLWESLLKACNKPKLLIKFNSFSNDLIEVSRNPINRYVGFAMYKYHVWNWYIFDERWNQIAFRMLSLFSFLRTL